MKLMILLAAIMTLGCSANKMRFIEQEALADNLKRQFLRAHNIARVAKGVPKLKWDKGLAEVADNYARYLAQTCSMVHSKSDYGENLAKSWGARPRSPAEVVGWWTNEEKYYDYKTNSCMPGKQCGHYTQVLWSSSTLLGCSIAHCVDRESQSKGIIYICNYSPPGNYRGVKPY